MFKEMKEANGREGSVAEGPTVTKQTFFLGELLCGGLTIVIFCALFADLTF